MKKLYRTPKDRILGGVCGGIGKYLDIDPVIIRLIWVLFTLCAGFTILIYIITWIIIPKEPLEIKPIIEPIKEESVKDPVEDPSIEEIPTTEKPKARKKGNKTSEN
jgi:phage shock protein C